MTSGKQKKNEKMFLDRETSQMSWLKQLALLLMMVATLCGGAGLTAGAEWLAGPLAVETMTASFGGLFAIVQTTIMLSWFSGELGRGFVLLQQRLKLAQRTRCYSEMARAKYSQLQVGMWRLGVRATSTIARMVYVYATGGTRRLKPVARPTGANLTSLLAGQTAEMGLSSVRMVFTFMVLFVQAWVRCVVTMSILLLATHYRLIGFTDGYCYLGLFSRKDQVYVANSLGPWPSMAEITQAGPDWWRTHIMSVRLGKSGRSGHLSATMGISLASVNPWVRLGGRDDCGYNCAETGGITLNLAQTGAAVIVCPDCSATRRVIDQQDFFGLNCHSCDHKHVTAEGNLHYDVMVVTWGDLDAIPREESRNESIWLGPRILYERDYYLESGMSYDVWCELCELVRDERARMPLKCGKSGGFSGPASHYEADGITMCPWCHTLAVAPGVAEDTSCLADCGCGYRFATAIHEFAYDAIILRRGHSWRFRREGRPTGSFLGASVTARELEGLLWQSRGTGGERGNPHAPPAPRMRNVLNPDGVVTVSPDDMYRSDFTEGGLRHPSNFTLHALAEIVFDYAKDGAPEGGSERFRGLWRYTERQLVEATEHLVGDHGIIICSWNSAHAPLIRKEPASYVPGVRLGICLIRDDSDVSTAERAPGWIYIAIPLRLEEDRLLASLRVVPAFSSVMANGNIRWVIMNGREENCDTVMVSRLWTAGLSYGCVVGHMIPTNNGAQYVRGGVFAADEQLVLSSFMHHGAVYGWDEVVFYVRLPIVFVADYRYGLCPHLRGPTHWNGTLWVSFYEGDALLHNCGPVNRGAALKIQRTGGFEAATNFVYCPTTNSPYGSLEVALAQRAHELHRFGLPVISYRDERLPRWSNRFNAAHQVVHAKWWDAPGAKWRGGDVESGLRPLCGAPVLQGLNPLLWQDIEDGSVGYNTTIYEILENVARLIAHATRSLPQDAIVWVGAVRDAAEAMAFIEGRREAKFWVFLTEHSFPAPSGAFVFELPTFNGSGFLFQLGRLLPGLYSRCDLIFTLNNDLVTDYLPREERLRMGLMGLQFERIVFPAMGGYMPCCFQDATFFGDALLPYRHSLLACLSKWGWVYGIDEVFAATMNFPTLLCRWETSGPAMPIAANPRPCRVWRATETGFSEYVCPRGAIHTAVDEGLQPSRQLTLSTGARKDLSKKGVTGFPLLVEWTREEWVRTGSSVSAFQALTGYRPLVIFTFGTRGDNIPLRAAAKVLVAKGNPVHLVSLIDPIAALASLKLCETKNGWRTAPDIVVCSYIVRACELPHLAPDFLGVGANGLTYSLRPHNKCVWPSGGGLGYGLDYLVKFFFWSRDADVRIGAYKGAAWFARSHNGEDFLDTSIAAPPRTGRKGVASGSSSIAPPAEYAEWERVPAGDHAVLFKQYEVIACAGGAGVVQTAAVAGCRVISWSNVIDRDYRLPMDAGAHVEGNEPSSKWLSILGYWYPGYLYASCGLSPKAYLKRTQWYLGCIITLESTWSLFWLLAALARVVIMPTFEQTIGRFFGFAMEGWVGALIAAILIRGSYAYLAITNQTSIGAAYRGLRAGFRAVRTPAATVALSLHCSLATSVLIGLVSELLPSPSVLYGAVKGRQFRPLSRADPSVWLCFEPTYVWRIPVGVHSYLYQPNTGEVWEGVFVGEENLGAAFRMQHSKTDRQPWLAIKTKAVPSQLPERSGAAKPYSMIWNCQVITVILITKYLPSISLLEGIAVLVFGSAAFVVLTLTWILLAFASLSSLIALLAVAPLGRFFPALATQVERWGQVVRRTIPMFATRHLACDERGGFTGPRAMEDGAVGIVMCPHCRSPYAMGESGPHTVSGDCSCGYPLYVGDHLYPYDLIVIFEGPRWTSIREARPSGDVIYDGFNGARTGWREVDNYYALTEEEIGEPTPVRVELNRCPRDGPPLPLHLDAPEAILGCPWCGLVSRASAGEIDFGERICTCGYRFTYHRDVAYDAIVIAWPFSASPTRTDALANYEDESVIRACYETLERSWCERGVLTPADHHLTILCKTWEEGMRDLLAELAALAIEDGLDEDIVFESLRTTCIHTASMTETKAPSDVFIEELFTERRGETEWSNDAIRTALDSFVRYSVKCYLAFGFDLGILEGITAAVNASFTGIDVLTTELVVACARVCDKIEDAGTWTPARDLALMFGEIADRVGAPGEQRKKNVWGILRRRHLERLRRVDWLALNFKEFTREAPDDPLARMAAYVNSFYKGSEKLLDEDNVFIRPKFLPRRPRVSEQELKFPSLLHSVESQVSDELTARVTKYMNMGGHPAIDGMWMSDETLRLASLERYTAPPLPFGEAEAELAEEVTQAMLKFYPDAFLNPGVVRPETVRDYLIKKYSPGLPFIGRYKSRKALMETGWMDAIIQATYSRLDSGLYPPQAYHAFTKMQVVDGEKVCVPGKLRTVVAQDIQSYFLDQVVQLYRNKTPTWSQYNHGIGAPLTGAYLGSVFEQLAKRKLVIKGDVRAYDANTPPIVFEVLTRLAEAGFNAVDIPAAGSVMRAKYLAMQNSVIVDLESGKVLGKKRGGGTGQSATSWDNTWGMRALVIMVWTIATGRPADTFHDTNTFHNTGDDNLWGTDDDLDPELIKTIASDMFGIDFKVEGTGRPEDLTYLGRRAIRGADVAKDILRVMPHIPLYTSIVDREQLLTRRAAYIARKAGAPDREYYAHRLERTVGHALLCAFDRGMYNMLAEEWMQDATHYLPVRIKKGPIGAATIDPTDNLRRAGLMFKVARDEDGNIEGVEPYFGAGVKPSAGMLTKLKYLKEMGALPTYQRILEVHVQHKVVPKPLSPYLTSQVRRPWEARIREGIIRFRAGVYRWFPDAIVRLAPAARSAPYHSIITIGGYPIEKFVYRTALLRDPELTQGEFGSTLRLSPYASATDANGFWWWVSIPGVKTRVMEEDLGVLKGRMILITIIYIVVSEIFERLRRLPWIGLMVEGWLIYTQDMSRLYASANTLYWLDTGSSSAAISSLMPRDPYATHKYIAVAIGAHAPAYLCLALHWVIPVTIGSLIAEGVSRWRTWTISQSVDVARKEVKPNAWMNLAADIMLASDKSGKNGLMIQAPTATGKSTAFLAAIKGYTQGRIWLVLPRIVLRDNYENPWWSENDIIKLHKGVRDTGAKLVVCTYGYLTQQVKSGTGPKEGDIVCLDEFHEATPYMGMAWFYLSRHAVRIFLLSATPRTIYAEHAEWMSVPLERPFESSAPIRLDLDPMGLYLEATRLAPHLKARALFIVPTLNEVERVLEALGSDGIEAHPLTRNQRIVPPTGCIVATSIVDSGITISPPPGLLIDSGLSVRSHRGRVSLHRTSPAVDEQRRGRVGRMRDGVVYSSILAGTGEDTLEYPSWTMLRGDADLRAYFCARLGLTHNLEMLTEKEASAIDPFMRIEGQEHMTREEIASLSAIWLLSCENADKTRAYNIYDRIQRLGWNEETEHHAAEIKSAVGTMYLVPREHIQRVLDSTPFLVKMRSFHVRCSFLCVQGLTITHG